MIPFKRLNKPVNILLAVILLAGLFLLIKTPVTNTGYGDSDEFLAVASHWGVTRAPEYTLYTGVLNAALNFPLPLTTPAWRAHAISTLALTGSLALFSLGTLNLLTRLYSHRRHQLPLILSVLLAVGIILSNQHLHTYALITDKYMSNLPALGLVFWAATSLLLFKKNHRRNFILLGLGTGLLLSFHQVLLFLLPLIGYVLYMVNKDRWPAYLPFAASFAATALVILGLLFWRLNVAPEPSLTHAGGLTGLTQVLAGITNQGNILYSTENSGYFHPFRLLESIRVIPAYTSFVLSSFYWWILPVLLLALAVLYRHRSQALLFISPFLLGGLAVAAYTGWPVDSVNQAAVIRYYTPALITLLPLLALGIFAIITRLKGALKALAVPKKYHLLGAVALPALLTGFFLVNTWRLVDLKGFTLVSDLYSEIIGSVDEGALVTCYSDTACHALLYEQTVNGRRPDVTVMPAQPVLVTRTLSAQKLERFGYTADPQRIFDVVTWNLDKRPVYAVDLTSTYLSLFGIDNGLIFYLPEGMAGRLSRDVPETLEPLPGPVSHQFGPVPEFDSVRRHLISSLTQTHFIQGYVWLKLGEREQAQQSLNTGVNLAYRLYDMEKYFSGAQRSEIEKTTKDDRYAYGQTVPDADDLVKLIPELVKEGYYARAIYLARAGLIVDPLHIDSRLELAKLYLLQEDAAQATKELLNVLSIDPDNEVAKQALANL
jgi:hypothetical protein